MKNKIFSLLLAAVFLLTGCGKMEIPQEQEVTGGYLEQSLSFPEGFLCTGIFPNEDNSVTLLGSSANALEGYDKAAGKMLGYQGGIQIWDVQPDGSWTQRPIPWEEELIRLCADAPHSVSLTMEESGTLYLLASEIYSLNHTPKEPFQLYRVEQDALVPIPVQFEGLDPDWAPECKFETDDWMCRLVGMTNGFLFVQNNHANWGIWDSEGKLRNSFVQRVGSTIFLHAIRNGYAWTGYSNDRELAYSMPDFQAVGRLELPDGYLFPDWQGDGFYHMTNGFDYNTQTTKERILSHYTLNGDTREILMRGNDFSWGASSVSLACETPDHAFWMIVGRQGEQKLCRYTYDPEKSIENTLTIFSLYGNNTLTQSIALWNQQHPETRIEHIVGVSDTSPSAMTEEDVIRQLNTQLLAGDGPDLLILDGLPADALIRQGLLSDLSALSGLDELRPNVRSAFERDGTLYAVPMGMRAYISGGLAGHVDDRIHSLEGLANAVESMPHPGESHDSCLSFVGPLYENLFDYLYPSSLSSIWQDGRFCSEGFLEFVKQLNRIARVHELETVAGYDKARQANPNSIEDTGEEWYQRGHFSSANEFWNGNSQWFIDRWNYAYDAVTFARIKRSETGEVIGTEAFPVTLYPMPGTEKTGVYDPVCVAAIPESSTQNRELAIQFLQLMLSPEIQQNVHKLHGLPVTRENLNAALEQVRKENSFSLTEDPNDLLDGMVPVTPDPVLQAAAREAAAKLYDGEFTEEEACKAIEDAAALRLAEGE